VLIDGADAFPQVAEAIENASHYVHLTGWHVAPYFELVRGTRPGVLGELLAETAERLDVRVLVWAGAPVPAFHPARKEVRAGVGSRPSPGTPGSAARPTPASIRSTATTRRPWSSTASSRSSAEST